MNCSRSVVLKVLGAHEIKEDPNSALLCTPVVVRKRHTISLTQQGKEWVCNPLALAQETMHTCSLVCISWSFHLLHQQVFA